MFGLRLKSWMEAHLGRPRHKSTNHQNQKHQRAPKDSSTSSGTTGCTSSGGSSAALVSNNTATTASSSFAGLSSSSNSNNPYSTALDLSPEEQNFNLDSSPSSDFSSTTNPTTSPSCSSVQIQSGGDPGRAQQQYQKQQQEELSKSNTKEDEKDQDQHQRSTCTRSSTTGSVANSTSNSILLGSFSNNLSSPDTGYSTDGYSPKSVYPALSFESSGKSTPKSSYTISSLVSSELLHSKHTTSLSSASCSVQNGLELDHECVSPLPTESLEQSVHEEIESKDNSCLSTNSGTKSSSIDNDIGRRNPKGESLIVRQHQHQLSSPSHSIKHGTQAGVSVLSPIANTTTSSSQDASRGNDTVTSKQYNSASTSLLTHVNESSSHCNTKDIMVAPTPTPRASNFTTSSCSQSLSNDNGNCKLPAFTGLSTTITKVHNNDRTSTAASDDLSSFSPDNNKTFGNLIQNHHNQHRRSESMDEQKSKNVSDDVDSSGDSSSLLTGPNRNIRTSFVLVTAAASQISECNSVLKNTFSVCSPRKERTRIKTNPWITLSQHNSNDVNSNANTESINNGAVVESHRRTKSQDHSHCSTSPVSESSQMMEKTTFHPNSNHATNPFLGGSNSSKGISEINNKRDITDEGQGKLSGGIGCAVEGMDHHDPSSLVYRISTSTNASDSGKGSLEPETNRNSTESSCLLSDSTASTRNSIISHEAEAGGSESRSRSSTGSTDTSDNGHGHGTFFQRHDSTERVSTTVVSGVEQQSQSSNNHCVSTINTVNSSNGSVQSSVAKGNKSNASICMGFRKSSSPKGAEVYTSYNYQNNNNTSHISEPKSGQETTVTSTTSITLPPELISSSGKTMVDKETDILSDWANTDDDGDDEIETDQNDDEGVTPTPSSPDTDTGGRAMFPNSQSTSSATDIDFGDSSAATAASSTGILLSSSNLRHHHHYTQNINKHSSGVAASGLVNGATGLTAPSPYHHHNIMNLPTTCYQPIQILSTPGMIPVEMYVQDRKEAYCNQSEPLANHHVLIQSTDVLGLPTGIPNANISLSSLYTQPSSLDSTDFTNANKPNSSSHAIARGALGFLRKIFKKGSCSSQRTSPGSNKLKVSRSSKANKDSYHHNIPSVVTGLRSPLLTADALVSPNPLVNRKVSLNGYFLTPTPNAFRRRSGTGTDSSDSKSSKHNNHHPSKLVKTDIIRLPSGALSPNQHGHSGSSGNNILQTSSSSASSSQNNSTTGAFCISSLQQSNAFGTGLNNDNKNGNGHSNTNTNSTTASSVHSMSTSISAASAANTNNNANSKTPRQNQSRLSGDTFYSNSNRQSTFMSNQQQNVGYALSPVLNPSCTSAGSHSTKTRAQPQLPSGPIIPPSSYSQAPHSPNITSQSQIIHYHHHYPQQGDFSAHPSMPITTSTATKGPCPYESPRLQNAPAPPHRINSPSFNNYSPIHRLVVTGANHLLNRGSTTSNPSPQPASQLVHQAQSASSQFHSNNNPHVISSVSAVGESPQLTSRHGKVQPTTHSYTQSNIVPHKNSSTTTFTPIVNRPVHHPNNATPSPLINHCQSISSPHHNSYQPTTSSSCLPPGSNTSSFASPSPILRNPRYQYITSSNQNSPILNVPKRINLPQTQHKQQSHHNNHGVVSAVVSIPQQPPPPAPPNLNGHGPPPFSTFSPVPPPRQNANHSNPFSSGASPNLNHHQHQQPFTPTRRQRSGSIGCEFENANVSNLQPVVVALQTQGNIPNSSSGNRSNILSRSQSYQTHQMHYYASPVIPPPPPPVPQQTVVLPSAMAVQQARMNPQTILPPGYAVNEPPLLMRTHLHNQNIRLNNFLMNKQRYQHQIGSDDTPSGRRNRFPNSESFQERIYETVDSEDEDGDEYSDDPEEPNFIGEVGNRRISAHEIQQRQQNPIHHEQSPYRDYYNNGSSGSAASTNIDNGRSNNMPESSFHYRQTSTSSRARNQQQSMKSKRSKPKTLSSSQKSEYHQSGSAAMCHPQQQMQTRPPVPMALFGPNTFLSETETKVLLTESDREADRKYKRLINEAEALLREISAVKSQQPWVYRSDLERLRVEDCPQSDPLRRKAYDCWALRRLQQELAGCCASPPVLHRSRMNLQSPSTPTASTHPYLTGGNLSLVHNQDPLQVMNPNHVDNNRNNKHF